MQHISVMLVDDHPVVRQGLVSLLGQYPDIRVVAQADRAETALEQARLRPDIILLDIRLDNANGLDLARQLRRSQCSSRIIILTSYDDETYLLEAARIGVDGYLLKNVSAEVLADAIRAVHAGEQQLSPALGGKALGQLRALSRSHLRAESGLGEEELQLLQFIADGLSVQEITRALYWSESTVKRKTKDVLAKLGATSRAQAIAQAFKRGLL
jgi:DNA-binding NarL/FixJ family response regulator